MLFLTIEDRARGDAKYVRSVRRGQEQARSGVNIEFTAGLLVIGEGLTVMERKYCPIMLLLNLFCVVSLNHVPAAANQLYASITV
jgi:hypothetical protein